MNVKPLERVTSFNRFPTYHYSATVLATTTSPAVVGFEGRIIPVRVTVTGSGWSIYSTDAPGTSIVSSTAVSDAIWNNITSIVTSGVTAELTAGLTGLVLVAGGTNVVWRVTG